MKKLLGLSCLMALSSTAISSFAANNNKTISLDAVTVVATKTEQKAFNIPGMVNVIDLQQSGNTNATGYSNLFKSDAGLEFNGSSRANGQTPNMRGFDDDAILILVDGVRQNFESAHDGRFFIDSSLLKKVEVVKSPVSTLYGSGGAAGAIAFSTVDAKDLLKQGQKVGAKISSGYQSVNNEKNTTISTYTAGDNYDGIIGLTMRDTGNVNLGETRQELRSNDNIKSGIAKLTYDINDESSIKFNLNGYSGNSKEPNNPQTGLSGTGFNQYVNKDITSFSGSTEYKLSADKMVNLTIRPYLNSTDINEKVATATSTNQVGDILKRKLETKGINIDNISYAGDNNTFAYGAEFYKDTQNGSDSRNGEVGGIPDSEAEYIGTYLQDEIKLSDLGSIPGEFYINPGARFDKYESKNKTGLKNDDSQLSPKLGVSYLPQKWLMLFGNYAHAFRAPSINEIYVSGTHFSIPGPGGGTNTFVPNPNLKPEKTKTAEFGFGFDFDKVLTKEDNFKLKASRYTTYADDYIDTQVNFVGFPCCGTTSLVNVNEAKIWGTDLTADYETGNLITGVGYSFVTGKNEQTGAFLTSITPPTVTSHLGYKLDAIDSTFGIKSRFATEHQKVNAATDKRNGYSVHDLYLTYQPKKFEDFTLDLGVDNLFDENYSRVFSASPEPGRNLKIQVSYKW